MKQARGVVVTPLLWLIRGYQVAVSPWLGPRCRFQPTCSEYAATAIARFGAWRGVGLAARRVARCHPWGGHGYDPVPDASPPPSVGPTHTGPEHRSGR